MKPQADFFHENRLWSQGKTVVAGIDEVGRGAWAGPVVAAAVVFPPFFDPPFALFDSKLLKPKQREVLSEKISSVAKVGIGSVEVPIINKSGIVNATQDAFKKAVSSLKAQTDFYLIDAFYISDWDRENQLPIKKGDRVCSSIAAASVVAKVYRDRIMRQLSTRYPKYGFERHKGYGTKFHQEAIARHKFSNIHRTSFQLTPYLNAG